MRRYIAYLRYICVHKFWVGYYCFKHGLYWRGLKHDLSKFFPAEFFPYARFFYNSDGSKRDIRDKSGYYRSTNTGDEAFDRAWFHHARYNDHHWQYWALETDQITNNCRLTITFRPPPDVELEMFCDSLGAAKALGKPDVDGWWKKNSPGMDLHIATRARLDKMFEGVQL